MKTNFRLMTTTFALITAASMAACGAQDKKADEAAAKSKNTEAKPVVEMKTSLGTIKIELDRKASPITVNNFLLYVESEHYDDTIFHRVIDGFMIQGGGFAKGETPKEKATLKPIKNEAKTNGLKNTKYTIAMARTNVPDSATSQFFINVGDNRAGLDPNKTDPRREHGYAVFGKVIDGEDVVEKIKGVKTGSSHLMTRGGKSLSGDVPVKPVVIESVRIVEKKSSKSSSTDSKSK